MPAHPVKARLRPTRGHLQEGWSRGTPPAWRPRDETRAPDTLVDAIFGAIADAGSIPAVSTFSLRQAISALPFGRNALPFEPCGVGVHRALEVAVVAVAIDPERRIEI